MFLSVLLSVTKEIRIEAYLDGVKVCGRLSAVNQIFLLATELLADNLVLSLLLQNRDKRASGVR